MSILIKRMEMPDDCRNCPFETYYMNCGETRCRATGKILADFYKPIPFEGRAEECPLIEVPSADVSEVIRGSWNNKGNFENLNPTNFEMYECSACGEWLSVGEVSFDYFEKHYNFCPNCGARMDGE